MRFAFLVILATLLVSVVSSVVARPKTDVIRLKNGDMVTCEIKELTLGKIRVKTDDMGTIDIEWDAIVYLETEYYFRVEDSDNEIHFGRLLLEEDSNELEVLSRSGSVEVPAYSVVGIVPIARSFWERQDGKLSVGFSFTKASKVSQFTFGWNNVFQTERNLIKLNASSILTRTGSDERTTRNVDLALAYYRLLKRSGWNGSTSLSFQRNDQLGLKQRYILSATPGYTPLKSNRNVLFISIGAAVNTEVGTDSTTGGDKATTSIEGVIATSYTFFKYDSPKKNVDTSLDIYPSFTENKRYRVEFDIKGSIEIVTDLMLELSYYLSYDSRAPSGEGHSADYGIVTSLGWSY